MGRPLPSAALIDMKMIPASVSVPGSIRLISVVPSLDTEVCDRQTHLLDSSALDKSIRRITISRDLPRLKIATARKEKSKTLSFYQITRLGILAGKRV